MPTSIYNYMDENLFGYLCTDPGTGENKKSLTSYAVPLKQCQCEGYNFYGMPDITSRPNAQSKSPLRNMIRLENVYVHHTTFL